MLVQCKRVDPLGGRGWSADILGIKVCLMVFKHNPSLVEDEFHLADEILADRHLRELFGRTVARQVPMNNLVGQPGGLFAIDVGDSCAVVQVWNYILPDADTDLGRELEEDERSRDGGYGAGETAVASHDD